MQTTSGDTKDQSVISKQFARSTKHLGRKGQWDSMENTEDKRKKGKETVFGDRVLYNSQKQQQNTHNSIIQVTESANENYQRRRGQEKKVTKEKVEINNYFQ